MSLDTLKISRHRHWQYPNRRMDIQGDSHYQRMVAAILRIFSIINFASSLAPSMFCHPGYLNMMAASPSFDLAPSSFISKLFSSICSPLQSLGSWSPCYPHLQITSLVISALCNQLCKMDTLLMPTRPHSTSYGPSTTPTCKWTTDFRTLTFLG